jgi:transcriptional regulator with XRE-family HTH domain
LAAAREAAGYTQEGLAFVLKIERTTVGRWERGVQSPQPWQRPGLAHALQVSLDALDDLLRRTARRPRWTAAPVTTQALVPIETEQTVLAPTSDSCESEPAAEIDVVRAAIPRLRRALDRLDLPDDGPTRPPGDLSGEIIRASDDRLQSRYRALALRLPELIAELARAGQLGNSADRRHTNTLLTLALRAADGVAFKFGYLDLSARLIDLMRSAAERAEDPLLLAAVAYVRTETFFGSGDLDAAARALELAADRVPAVHASAMSSAAFGALHMRAAVVAGRASKSDRAADHLREARRAAAVVPEGVYQGTAFGPASLRIHELAVAVELRDPLSIDRAAAWRPPAALPAERRSHYFIDLGRAQLALGRHEDAYLCLQAAREAAPEHTRAHPQVRQSLAKLLRTHTAPSSGLLDLAAWARAC